MVSQGLTLSVLRLQEAWGYVLKVNIFHLLERGFFLHLQNNSGNVHQIHYYLGTSERSQSRAPGGRPVLGRRQGVLLGYKITMVVVGMDEFSRRPADGLELRCGRGVK